MKRRAIDHSDNWETPPYFYDVMKHRYKIDWIFEAFDPCPINHDITLFDGLAIDWHKYNYVNPGYSLKVKTNFVEKALKERFYGRRSVLLIPVSTSTVLFHKQLKPNAERIEFIEGRVPFIGINTKGQRVNYHLKYREVMEEDRERFINYNGKPIPKYIKASGQHDSMLIIL